MRKVELKESKSRRGYYRVIIYTDETRDTSHSVLISKRELLQLSHDIYQIIDDLNSQSTHKVDD